MKRNLFSDEQIIGILKEAEVGLKVAVRWSMERLLTMVDGWDRSCPHIEVDHSLTGERVVRVLERLKQQGRLPNVLQMDNGRVLPHFDGRLGQE